MRRIIAAILGQIIFGALSVCALDDVSVPYAFSDSGVIEASEFNANFDTIEVRIGQLNDSLELKWARWIDLLAGDSTFTRVTTDSLTGLNVIRGNPDIDSISGNPYVDSVNAGYINADTVNSPLVFTDSIKGLVYIDSIQGMNYIRGNPNIDSISGSPRINAATITGTLNADSVASTKGITSTYLNTGQGNNELYAMNQDVETTDAVTFATVNTGQGANELYDMDQNVLTTSDVQFDSVNVRRLNIDTLVFDSDQSSAPGIGLVWIDTLVTTHQTIDSMDVLEHIDTDSIDASKATIATANLTDINHSGHYNTGAVAVTTISSNAIASNNRVVWIVNEGGADKDTLATITGASEGDIITIINFNNGDTCVVQQGLGFSLLNSTDALLVNQLDNITVIKASTATFVEIGRTIE